MVYSVPCMSITWNYIVLKPFVVMKSFKVCPLYMGKCFSTIFGSLVGVSSLGSAAKVTQVGPRLHGQDPWVKTAISTTICHILLPNSAAKP